MRRKEAMAVDEGFQEQGRRGGYAEGMQGERRTRKRGKEAARTERKGKNRLLRDDQLYMGVRLPHRPHAWQAQRKLTVGGGEAAKTP